MNKKFWKGKKVLVTGHTGFKGSWLCLWLQKLEVEVIGYALSPPTQLNLFEDSDVAKNMKSIIGDVRDLDKLKSTIEKHQPEIVIHMAAQPLVRYSYENPVETYTTNVIGTVNLLEAVRLTNCVKVVINVTSDKCYENREWVWSYRENEAMGGYDPYSSSKGCSELVTSAYVNSYFKNEKHSDSDVLVSTARAGNVIGGGDWADDRLIPDLMRAFINNENVSIRNPHSIRPWQHVLEPLHGYMMLVEKLWEDGTSFVGGWNFGPNEDDSREVLWIVKYLAKTWGQGATWSLEKDVKLHEANNLKLDCSKAKTQLGWYPLWDLSTTLSNVAAWYRSYLNKEDIRKVTISQIETFQNSLN